jgi:hypothetical protein
MAKKYIFIAAIDGTKQLFEVNFPGLNKIAVRVQQITNGDFDVNDHCVFLVTLSLLMCRYESCY